MKFKVGDKIVYQGHGVGSITNFQTKELSGEVRSFFTITLSCGLKIMVPSERIEQVGLRRILSKSEILEVLSNIHTAKSTYHSGWIMRYRELMAKIKTGEFSDTCEAFRHLKDITKKGELSFGEAKLYSVVKDLVITEVALAYDMHKNKAEEFINGIMS